MIVIMKKYLLLFVLFGSISFAYCMEDLEQAVQNSNLEQVTDLLPRIQFTLRDKERFIHLAHDVFCFRRNKLEVAGFMVSWSDMDKLALTLRITGMTGFAAGVICHDQFHSPLIVGGFIMTGIGLVYGQLETVTRFKKQYHNALKIKQLMLDITPLSF